MVTIQFKVEYNVLLKMPVLRDQQVPNDPSLKIFKEVIRLFREGTELEFAAWNANADDAPGLKQEADEKYEEALCTLGKYWTGHPTRSFKDLCLLGTYYLLKGDHKEAKIQFERAAKIAGEKQILFPDPYVGLAEVELSGGNFKKAVDYYEKALEMDKALYSVIDESLAEAYVGQAKHLMLKPEKNAANYEKAKELCDKAKSVCPILKDQLRASIAEVYKQFGLHLAQKNMMNDALYRFDAASKLCPDNRILTHLSTLCMLAELIEKHLAKEEIEKAETNLSGVEKICKFAPEGVCIMPGILVSMAKFYFYKRGDYKKAETTCDRILAIDHLNRNALMMKGQCISILAESKLLSDDEMLAETENALKSFSELEETDKNDPEVWYQVGLVWMRAQKYEMALSYFSRAAKLGPNDIRPLERLGLIYYLLDDELMMTSSFENAMRVAQKNGTVSYFSEAMFAYINKDYQRSIERFEAYLKELPPGYDSDAEKLLEMAREEMKGEVGEQ